tara:strand:- start:403 stop:714 length:312 start_codon:yes stop_codon:yes gene_type:complete
MGIKMLDQYSLLHFSVGIVFYFWNVPLLQSLMLHFLFEIVENTEMGMNIINTWFKNIWPGGKYSSDSPMNIFGDNIFFVIGWLLAKTLDEMGDKYGWYKVHLK